MILKKTNDTQKKPNGKLNVGDRQVFEAIKKRAYELYCKRGYSHGNDRHDWFVAEQQVKKELGLNK